MKYFIYISIHLFPWFLLSPLPYALKLPGLAVQYCVRSNTFILELGE